MTSEQSEVWTRVDENWLREYQHERQPTEIWTRVMGYHRPVNAFNKGKQAEFEERKMMLESKCEAR